MNILALLFIHFAQNLADSSAENSTIHYNESAILPASFLCADGKGPLLEGEERIFPCDGQCPAGFECETVKGMNDGGGICCPNLEELYK